MRSAYAVPAFPKLDIFVGNAAMLGTLAPLGHLKPDEFQQVMNLNVMAVI